MITHSPLHNNTYIRKNIEVVFDEDFKYARIITERESIVVDGSFFKDVVKVIDSAIESVDDAEEIRWNTLSTALSEPYDKDEFNDTE